MQYTFVFDCLTCIHYNKAKFYQCRVWYIFLHLCVVPNMHYNSGFRNIACHITKFSTYLFLKEHTPALHIATFIGIVLCETRKRIWYWCFCLYCNFLFCNGIYQINKQCYDSFRRTVKGLSHTYTYIHSPPHSSHPDCHKTLSTVSCAI